MVAWWWLKPPGSPAELLPVRVDHQPPRHLDSAAQRTSRLGGWWREPPVGRPPSPAPPARPRDTGAMNLPAPPSPAGVRCRAPSAPMVQRAARHRRQHRAGCSGCSGVDCTSTIHSTRAVDSTCTCTSTRYALEVACIEVLYYGTRSSTIVT